jgi:hypothetical protein
MEEKVVAERLLSTASVCIDIYVGYLWFRGFAGGSLVSGCVHGIGGYELVLF